MRGADKLPGLIEDIYDAALSPALWSGVVASINEYVGGHACGIFSKDSASKFGHTHYYCGADPYYIQLYSDSHSQFDPLTALPALAQIVSIPDLVEYDEYRRGPFYQEWLRPQGCVDAANVVLEKSSSSSAVLMTVLSGARMVDNEMRRRLAMVVPHAQRALAINRAIEFKQAETATFADMLNGLSAGIFFVEANCRLVHANAAGVDLISADDFLRSINGFFTARDERFNQALRDLIAAHSIGIGIAESNGFPLIASDGTRYILHALPLTSADRKSIGSAHKAVAALFVRKVGLDNPCAELLARTFELTPAELRVMFAIVEVGGVPDTAKALGVAETTVKTHLSRVFAKTGANRQADLVKLAAGFSNPLAR